MFIYISEDILAEYNPRGGVQECRAVLVANHRAIGAVGGVTDALTFRIGVGVGLLSRRQRASRDRRDRGNDCRSRERSPLAASAASDSIASFLAKYAAEVPEDVRARTSRKLEEAGYTFEWQVKVVPREVLLHVFPPQSHGMELTATVHAQRMALPSQAGGDVAVIEQLQKIASQQKMHAKETKRLRKTHNNDAESSSASACEGGLDAAECLKKYGLPSLDHGHLMPFDSLKKFVKSAG